MTSPADAHDKPSHDLPEKPSHEKPSHDLPERPHKLPKGDPEATILVDGDPAPVPYPDAKNRPRRISLHGVNYEHVGESPDGVWTYRAM